MRTIYTPVYEEQARSIEVRSAEVFEAGGTKLKSDDVLKRVTAGTVVVMSADGKKVDPAYLRLLAKDTLVIVSRQYAFQNSQVARHDGDWAVRPAYSVPQNIQHNRNAGY